MSAPVWAIVLVGGLGTFAARFSFLSIARRTSAMPAAVREALRMIPAAALAALVAPVIVGSGEATTVAVVPRVVATVVAMLVMHRTRNVLVTLVAGMAVLLGLWAAGWTA